MELVRCYIQKFSSYLSLHIYSLLKNFPSSSVVPLWKSCILQKLLKIFTGHKYHYLPDWSLLSFEILHSLLSQTVGCLKVALSSGPELAYQQKSGILIHDKGFCKLTVQRSTSTVLDFLSLHDKFEVDQPGRRLNVAISGLGYSSLQKSQQHK